MNNIWFKKWGWVHKPVSTTGWLITIFSFLLVCKVFYIIDSSSHSASDTLIGVFPWAWIILASLNWIASKTSK